MHYVLHENDCIDVDSMSEVEWCQIPYFLNALTEKSFD